MEGSLSGKKGVPTLNGRAKKNLYQLWMGWGWNQKKDRTNFERTKAASSANATETGILGVCWYLPGLGIFFLTIRWDFSRHCFSDICQVSYFAAILGKILRFFFFAHLLLGPYLSIDIELEGTWSYTCDFHVSFIFCQSKVTGRARLVPKSQKKHFLHPLGLLHKKSLPWVGIEPTTLRSQDGCLTTRLHRDCDTYLVNCLCKSHCGQTGNKDGLCGIRTHDPRRLHIFEPTSWPLG